MMTPFHKIIQLLYPDGTAAENATVTIQTDTSKLYHGTAKDIPQSVLDKSWTIVSIIPNYSAKYDCSDDKYKNTPTYNLPKIINVV